MLARIASRSLLLLCVIATSAVAEVRVSQDDSGHQLLVDGQPFFVKGMNWDYFPVGTNYSYSLWSQSEDFIQQALDQEMSLLTAMGANTVRQYVGVPARWVEYMYERWGVYTVINHPLGRYGLTIDGNWVASTDYSDERTREVVLAEIDAMVDAYQGTPGLLMYLLGNENNYGLYWSSAETEDLPEEEKYQLRATYMYTLFEDATQLIKGRDTNVPVAIANGDLQYLDIMKRELKSLDIFGANMYRGITFTDAFERLARETDWPFMLTEFGCDAFHAINLAEDQQSQAEYLLGQWQDIMGNARGLGGAGNALGGLTFQWSDGWWKYLQESNLDVHDNNASWANGGYPYDLAPGENNMNEEWWGVCAKGPTQADGHFELYPRAAYYALQGVNRFDPCDPEASRQGLLRHIQSISPVAMVNQARGSTVALASQQGDAFRISGLRMEFETISTGGKRISTPEQRATSPDSYPSFQGFDRLESFYVDVEARPAGNMRAELSLNILGNVPENPIDEIFYENRDRPVRVLGEDGWKEIGGQDRVRVYSASVSWQQKWFNVDGFYRSGHYHWGYEGDFFGLYREANYGPNIDMYNGMAPIGMELEGRRQLKGLSIAMGPELWWGANPTVLVKYSRPLGSLGALRDITASMVYQEDLDDQASIVSSIAVPTPPTRKATLHLKTMYKRLGVELGGIWSGSDKLDDAFVYIDDAGNPLLDHIRSMDTFGGKLRLTMTKGSINWYAQGAMMGLVADAGPTAIQTYTGWRLADSGMGNQVNAMTGFTWTMGNLQLAPNVLWQKPIEGPNPEGYLRNVVVGDDPFAVRANREMIAGEFLLTWDPTPATWMYAWNNDMAEDAPLAFNLGLVYKRYETGTDAGQYFAEDGVTIYPYDASTPARDIWEVHSRIVAKRGPKQGIIANLYAGTGEANGDFAGDASLDRLIHRYGADARWIVGDFKTILSAKVNDWGPYDYHRDFNYTYPLQLAADLSTSLGAPDWWGEPQSRLGIKLTWRSLDEYSNRYCPVSVYENGEAVCDPEAEGYEDGREWEIRTYLHVGI